MKALRKVVLVGGVLAATLGMFGGLGGAYGDSAAAAAVSVTVSGAGGDSTNDTGWG
ncbi:hypothetical protein [Streptomyces sp. NPDC046821]|uniref:hypothetical protein n=1 Tax=Streptomyces sp. NPDC046821 TaxID=3154702 RepID=UPI0033FC3C06